LSYEFASHVVEEEVAAPSMSGVAPDGHLEGITLEEADGSEAGVDLMHLL